MPPRMSLKPDTSFFRKLAIGAVGAGAVKAYLDGLGHNLAELERGSLDTRIWKDVKRKRVRIPDLVCTRCSVRVESRAKTKAELSMSHSPKDAERSWDFGMVPDDLIAFPVCQVTEVSWTDCSLRGTSSLWNEQNLCQWAVDGRINIFDVRSFRRVPFRKKLAKGVTEGSETQVFWPARFASAQGVVTAIDRSRVKFTEDVGAKPRHLKVGTGARAFLRVGQRFERNQVLAGEVAPLANADLRCEGECPAATIERMVASRERTVRFTGCRLARLRSLQALSPAIRELAVDAEEDPYARLEARAYLCVVQGESADQWFAELVMQKADPQMQLEAVVALADVRTPSSFQLLQSILRAPAHPLFLRSAAAWALGCHSTEEAARVLVEAFADVEVRIKEEALAAVTQIGQVSVSPLLWGLGQASQDVAAGSAEVIRRIGDVPLDEVVRMAQESPARAWPVWTLAHLPRSAVAPRIAALQEEHPELHFAVTVLWSFLDSWVADHWTKRALP